MSRAALPGRLNELDALRGIAAVMVLAFHFTWQSVNVYPAAIPVAAGLDFGKYGVQLFFAISGFVILMTLERTTSATDFVLSRLARLFPSYWAAIALTSIGVVALGAGELSQPMAIVALNLTMLEGFLNVPAVDGVYWSLTVEIAFYGCMLALWRLRLLDRIEPILAGWMGLTLLWRLLPWLSWRVGLVLVAGHIAWFAIGMLCYRVWSGARSWAQQLPLMAFGFAVIALTEPAVTLAVYALVLAIFVALACGALSSIDHPLLLRLGALSYPLYLVHQNLGYAAIARIEDAGASPETALVCAMVLALALAQAIHSLVERPALALLRGLRRPARSAHAT